TIARYSFGAVAEFAAELRVGVDAVEDRLALANVRELLDERVDIFHAVINEVLVRPLVVVWGLLSRLEIGQRLLLSANSREAFAHVVAHAGDRVGRFPGVVLAPLHALAHPRLRQLHRRLRDPGVEGQPDRGASERWDVAEGA